MPSISIGARRRALRRRTGVRHRVARGRGRTMLHDVKELDGIAVGAMDGEVGTVTDLYFDDQHWAIRYLVVETGIWLGGRKVLISPSAIRGVAWESDIIDVWLSR